MELNFTGTDATDLMNKLSAKSFVPNLWDKFLYVQLLLNAQEHLACGKIVAFSNSDQLKSFIENSNLPHISISTFDNELLIINMRTHDELHTGCLVRDNSNNMLFDYTLFVFVSDEPDEIHKYFLDQDCLKPIFVAKA